MNIFSCGAAQKYLRMSYSQVKWQLSWNYFPVLLGQGGSYLSLSARENYSLIAASSASRRKDYISALSEARTYKAVLDMSGIAENLEKNEQLYFNAETGKFSPIKTDDKQVAIKMAADGFFVAPEVKCSFTTGNGGGTRCRFLWVIISTRLQPDKPTRKENWTKLNASDRLQNDTPMGTKNRSPGIVASRTEFIPVRLS